MHTVCPWCSRDGFDRRDLHRASRSPVYNNISLGTFPYDTPDGHGTHLYSGRRKEIEDLAFSRKSYLTVTPIPLTL